MATSISNPQPACYHTRSNSFPSRSLPQNLKVSEHFSRLRTSESASSSSSSISLKLSALQDLHDCIYKLLQLPLTQRALAKGQGEKWVDELIDGSLSTLDVCSTAKDALLQMKECLHDLQSSIRSKRGDEIGLASEVRKYLNREKVHKNLKGVENKYTIYSLNKADETVSIDIINMLREVELIKIGCLSLHCQQI
ncbi:hypothetical protein CRYUN_Cryun18bG0125900 [Craigia yunnanensis]